MNRIMNHKFERDFVTYKWTFLGETEERWMLETWRVARLRICGHNKLTTSLPLTQHQGRALFDDKDASRI